GHVIGTAICLSSLLEAGRYRDLIELLACARMRWWHWHRFGAEALARQGVWDAAIAYADGCRTPQGYDDRQIDRFCEAVLIKSISPRPRPSAWSPSASGGTKTPTYPGPPRKARRAVS
ncbi:MAG TPA: hypothetical protein VIM52_13850, partial [Stellaceae bacterium]